MILIMNVWIVKIMKTFKLIVNCKIKKNNK